MKTFDETWDLLKRRHARVFDEELWNVPDHDLPSKTETYKIVKDCCFHYKWHLPLYDVVVADYGVHAETFASKLASRLEAVGKDDAEGVLRAYAATWRFWHRQLYLSVGLFQWLEQDHCARHAHLGVVSLWRRGVEALRDAVERREGLLRAAVEAVRAQARAERSRPPEAFVSEATEDAKTLCEMLHTMERYTTRDPESGPGPHLEEVVLRDAREDYEADVRKRKYRVDTKK